MTTVSGVLGVEKVTRRDFLAQTGLGAGALVLGCHVSAGGMGGLLFAQEGTAAFEPNQWIAIDSDGTVVIIAHRSEMGQGIRSTLPAVVADELEADWNRVVVRQAIGDAKYGNQWTDGSRSVTMFLQPMREAGAAARQMLVAAAAGTWGVAAAECEAREHRVWHQASGRSLDYGELAESAAAQPVPGPEQLELKPASKFRYIGRDDMPFFDLGDIVTGKAVFGADVRLPGMLTAMIERCPVVGGRLKSFDGSAALRVPGVKQVFEIRGEGGLGGGFLPLGGVAVVADNTYAAWQGRKALQVEWDPGPHGGYDSEAYRAELEASTSQPGTVVRSKGDVDAALAGAREVVEASYYVPHLAQAPMEPLVATAWVDGRHLKVWAPTQCAQATETTVRKACGIVEAAKGAAYLGPGNDIEEVTVNVTLLGGGFGRKSKPDFVAEAALVAQKMRGTPIRVQWTREDDIRHSYYHAVSHQYLKGALDAQGRPVAWLHRSAFPTLQATIGSGTEKLAGVIELGQGFVDLPFAVPNLRLENCEAEAHTRIGWMRSVANIYHAFAIGSFADELARAAGRDSKDFLLELIGPPRLVDLTLEGVEDYHNNTMPIDQFPIDAGRLRNVVERVAEEAGWGKRLPPGRGLGIAAHRSFLSYVAVVVDAEVGPNHELTIHEIHAAIDCGLAVNPDRVRAQVEGGVIYGLSLAIHDDITFRNGAVEQRNFHDYPTIRLNQTPRKIAVYIVDNPDQPPGGVGEPPVPPLAPALCNAIAAAGGPRVRDLPLWRSFEFG
jgi:isoquinoline 1-oxidoreductase beta subunit